MSDMHNLIEAHRAALSAFNAVVAEQGRLEDQEVLTRACAVDLLLSYQTGAGVVTGASEEELRQKLIKSYDDHAVSLLWLHRHRRDLYDDAEELLTYLRSKNLSFVPSAFAAWRQDRERLKKKEAELEARWQEVNAAETAAAVALLRHPAGNQEEESERAAYIQQTRIITSDFNAYSSALLQSYLPERVYTPNKVYWSLEHGNGSASL